MNPTTATTPEALRAAMVDRVKQAGWAQTDQVEHAMRTVPRHLFVPNASLTDAYDEQAVITKTAPDGTALSCASVPGIVAMMLDQLRVEPGHRILEIGAGTGYNAALLAELTGPTGHVTTIDIDPAITTTARRALDATSYRHIYVATRDGALGDEDRAPYDRIIVTVGAWDIPPAWWTQLRTGGRLVVPLRWRGQTRSLALTHHGDHMTADSIELCGFVPMIGQAGEHQTYLDPDHHVSIQYDADQPIKPEALQGILDQPRTIQWSTTTVTGDESFDGIWLRLTAAEPGTCRITADTAAVDTDLCTPAIPVRSPALIDRGFIAYLAVQGIAGNSSDWTLGAISHGSSGPELSHRLCTQINAWGRAREAKPAIVANRILAPDSFIGNGAIRKQFSTLAVSATNG